MARRSNVAMPAACMRAIPPADTARAASRLPHSSSRRALALHAPTARAQALVCEKRSVSTRRARATSSRLARAAHWRTARRKAARVGAPHPRCSLRWLRVESSRHRSRGARCKSLLRAATAGGLASRLARAAMARSMVGYARRHSAERLAVEAVDGSFRGAALCSGRAQSCSRRRRVSWRCCSCLERALSTARFCRAASSSRPECPPPASSTMSIARERRRDDL